MSYAKFRKVVGQCWQQPVRCYVQGRPGFLCFVDSFFNKPLQKEIRLGEVWWSWWPKSTPTNAVSRQVSHKTAVVVRNTGDSSNMLKPAIQFILFQHCKESNSRCRESSEVIVFAKNNSTTTGFWNTSPKAPIFDDCRGFSVIACVFSALSSLLFWLLSYAFKCNHASFVKKNKMAAAQTS